MYPNLNAEQARFGHTNKYVANYLGISRATYRKKKSNGNFKATEARKLCVLYDKSFDYLFSIEQGGIKP